MTNERTNSKTARGMMGVYAIKNTKTGHSYIGSSRSINGRWHQHISFLVGQAHLCRQLQQEWNEHGPTAFEFSILEIVKDVETMHERERHWLDHFYGKAELMNPRRPVISGRGYLSIHKDTKIRLEQFPLRSNDRVIRFLLDHYEANSDLPPFPPSH